MSIPQTTLFLQAEVITDFAMTLFPQAHEDRQKVFTEVVKMLAENKTLFLELTTAQMDVYDKGKT